MRASALLVCVITMAGCASTRRDPACDPETTNCGGTDAPMADAPPDGPPKKGFSEPCIDNGQCESNLCILVGTSGQCTMTCGTCPDGYGCVGVEGIEIEGQITFVCVPTSNQLCTTCTQDSECTLIGMDKCVTYADGDRACARDCSSVGCPVGYSCEDVNIGGANYRQCMASSGACDCTEANPGAMQPCNIMTPWNVCAGAQTCNGGAGWGTCQPPSPDDDPDPGFVDSNCDGIDGDLARAIFVSPAGNNSATCGLVHTDPCQTISFGITRAVEAGRPHVYVQAGTYTGSITMANGVSVFGGYNFNWRRQAYSAAGHTVTISGGIPAVRFNGITAPTWLDNVVVRSSNATGASGSSVAVVITSSQAVELRGVLVEPGAGTAGLDGGNGNIGAGGGTGGTDIPGCENSSGFCSSCSRPAGGLAGASSCGRPGGVGGQPGHGTGGGSPGGTGTIGTPGGAGASCGGSRSCGGQVGFDGAIGQNGPNGSGGTNIGTFSGFTYVAANGTSGVDGGHGNGGGGGGGGGGGDDDCDSYGSSGGGGGGGGCGGTRGTSGSGGGGSFGVIALDSQLTISSSLIAGGTGGGGGRGGNGGTGGAGGTGGNGGPYGGGGEQDDGGDGARGGRGGNGGRGGDGGGGGGGPSVAVVCLGASANTVTVLGSTLSPGTGGSGGTSGAAGAPGLSAMSYGCSF
ncbi:MAG: hypothetical protein ACTHU0_35000 [Kofleriaceae bacterium]